MPTPSAKMAAPPEKVGEMSFRFVTFSDPTRMRDPATKREIRQQAMKEIGKSRRKPKKNKFIELDISALLDGQGTQLAEVGRLLFPGPSYWLGGKGLDPFVRYPVELDREGMELVANIFRDDVPLQLAMRDAWFTVGLADPATFYQVLSNSALHLDTLKNGGRLPQTSHLSIHYNQIAIKDIKKRLEKKETQATTEVIGCLSGFLAHDAIAGAYDRWKMHHEALKKMIKLHEGGLEDIDKNETLRVTLSWVELRGAYAQDLTPFMPWPQQWREVREPPPPSPEQLPALASRILPSSQGSQVFDNWLDTYKSLINFSLQTDVEAQSLEHLSQTPQSGQWVAAMAHRLLNVRSQERLEGSARPTTKDVCRIGALLYLAPIWRRYGVHPVRTNVLVSGFQEAFFSVPAKEWKLWELRLWMLYMASMEAQPMPQFPLFVDEIAFMMKDHSLHTWREVQTVVKGILWVRTVFDGMDEYLRIHVEESLRAIYEYVDAN